ncbi:hypothetical protein EG829_30965, partial [bacterium]|nr:hypothetical protein [bacterium]
MRAVDCRIGHGRLTIPRIFIGRLLQRSRSINPPCHGISRTPLHNSPDILLLGGQSGQPAMSTSQSLSLSGHIARVDLHRPPVNALDQELVRELTRIARLLAKRKDVWLISITSSLQTFCAGADLKERAALSPAQILSTVTAIQRMVRAWVAV